MIFLHAFQRIGSIIGLADNVPIICQMDLQQVNYLFFIICDQNVFAYFSLIIKRFVLRKSTHLFFYFRNQYSICRQPQNIMQLFPGKPAGILRFQQDELSL